MAALERHGATRMVAEVNQGGDMVESMLRTVDAAGALPRGAGDASGKAARAEPVAALYEQGRVAHVRGLARLEEQMCQMTRGGVLGPRLARPGGRAGLGADRADARSRRRAG